MVIVDINGSNCGVDDDDGNLPWKSRLTYYKNLVRNSIVARKTFRITAKGVLIKLKAELLNRFI